MSIQLQPSVPLVTLVKIESPTVIKIEPPEEVLEKQISADIKDIDIVYHSFSEDLIKSETVPENILETKYSESVETQVLVKTEDTSEENVTRGTGQEVIEIQGLNEYSNVLLGNLESDKQLIYLSRNFNAFSSKNRKAKQPEETNFAKCYKTVDTTLWKKDKEKIKVIKAPLIPVEAHEYTSLGKDKYVCNHCQHAYNLLSSLRRHIKEMHRKLTTIYQCPYCPYYYKFRSSLKKHIIVKHKDTKDIQWFQYFSCDNCNFKTDNHHTLRRHNLVHLKPEEIEYFYCYHCSYKSKRKSDLKNHIFIQHFKNVKQGKRFGCNKCDYKTYTNAKLKSHKLIHLKPEKIQYFYCYHCSYKTKWKSHLKKHIFIHFKKEQVKFDCYICNFMTPKRESIIKHIKKHSKVQNKSEINEGS